MGTEAWENRDELTLVTASFTLINGPDAEWRTESLSVDKDSDLESNLQEETTEEQSD